MENKKVTFKNAILAKCHDCMGEYLDGMVDCRNHRCALYSYMPYRRETPNLDWTGVHPKRQGTIFLRDIEVSEKAREAGRRLAAKMNKGTR